MFYFEACDSTSDLFQLRYKNNSASATIYFWLDELKPTLPNGCSKIFWIIPYLYEGHTFMLISQYVKFDQFNVSKKKRKGKNSFILVDFLYFLDL